MDDLKPCPFCGSAADANQYLIEAAVWCPQCLATVTRSATADCDYSDMQLAASAWNTRTSEPVAIEALQAQLAEARDKALEDAARMVDCACECREAVLTANTRVERWNACGRDPCGALDAADIRAMKGERG